jgi:hypothetical protein
MNLFKLYGITHPNHKKIIIMIFVCSVLFMFFLVMGVLIFNNYEMNLKFKEQEVFGRITRIEVIDGYKKLHTSEGVIHVFYYHPDVSKNLIMGDSIAKKSGEMELKIYRRINFEMKVAIFSPKKSPKFRVE